MPSDLVVSIRQISNYPEQSGSNGTENLLAQVGGVGGPYVSMSTANLVSTALSGDVPLGVGTGIPPQAGGAQVFTADLVTPMDGAHLWNQYEGTDGLIHYWNPGPAAVFEYDGQGGFLWLTAPVGNPGAIVQGATELLTLNPAGAARLPLGTLTVARDPATPFEVATANWVGNNTVSSFNNRIGQVQLNAQDVYSALQLCDPIATQPWTYSAINAAIQNLLYTCNFVNTWNGRKGQVYLMLSDITCVFYQPGQQPISPTPPATSNDDSIATTKWISQLYAPAPTQSTPPINPTSGQLWWNDVDGNLYVYYQDQNSAQWVSAFADAGGTGAFLPLSGGHITPGKLYTGADVTWAGDATSAGMMGWLYILPSIVAGAPPGDGGGAITAITRASDYNVANLGGNPQAYSITAFALADIANGTAECAYLESRTVTVGATTITLEMDTGNYAGPIPTINPYQVVNAGASIAIALAAGGDTNTPGPSWESSAALVIDRNATKWHRGIVFGADAVTGTDGVTGTGVAIEIAKGQELRWTVDTLATRGGFIRADTPAGSTAVGMVFNTGAINFVTSDGAETGLATLNALGDWSCWTIHTGSSITAVGASLSSGLSFGSVEVASATDLTRHIALYDGWGGFNVSAGTLNIVAAGQSVVQCTGTQMTVNGTTVVNGTLTVGAGATTWTSGLGAPTATAQAGSLYSQIDGAVGTHLYVSAGGSTWNPVAGV